MVVQALYYERIHLCRFLKTCFLTEIVVMVAVLVLSMPDIKYGVHCVTIYFPVKVVVFLYVPFHLVLVVLCRPSSFSLKRLSNTIRDASIRTYHGEVLPCNPRWMGSRAYRLAFHAGRHLGVCSTIQYAPLSLYQAKIVSHTYSTAFSCIAVK